MAKKSKKIEYYEVVFGSGFTMNQVSTILHGVSFSQDMFDNTFHARCEDGRLYTPFTRRGMFDQARRFYSLVVGHAQMDYSFGTPTFKNGKREVEFSDKPGRTIVLRRVEEVISTL